MGLLCVLLVLAAALEVLLAGDVPLNGGSEASARQHQSQQQPLLMPLQVKQHTPLSPAAKAAGLQPRKWDECLLGSNIRGPYVTSKVEIKPGAACVGVRPPLDVPQWALIEGRNVGPAELRALFGSKGNAFHAAQWGQYNTTGNPPPIRALLWNPYHGLGNTLQGFLTASSYAFLSGRRILHHAFGAFLKTSESLCSSFHCMVDQLEGTRDPGYHFVTRLLELADGQGWGATLARLDPWIRSDLRLAGRHPWYANASLERCILQAFGCTSHWCLHSRQLQLLIPSPGAVLADTIDATFGAKPAHPLLQTASSPAGSRDAAAYLKLEAELLGQLDQPGTGSVGPVVQHGGPGRGVTKPGRRRLVRQDTTKRSRGEFSVEWMVHRAARMQQQLLKQLQEQRDAAGNGTASNGQTRVASPSRVSSVAHPSRAPSLLSPRFQRQPQAAENTTRPALRQMRSYPRSVSPSKKQQQQQQQVQPPSAELTFSPPRSLFVPPVERKAPSSYPQPVQRHGLERHVLQQAGPHADALRLEFDIALHFRTVTSCVEHNPNGKGCRAGSREEAEKMALQDRDLQRWLHARRWACLSGLLAFLSKLKQRQHALGLHADECGRGACAEGGVSTGRAAACNRRPPSQGLDRPTLATFLRRAVPGNATGMWSSRRAADFSRAVLGPTPQPERYPGETTVRPENAGRKGGRALGEVSGRNSGGGLPPDARRPLSIFLAADHEVLRSVAVDFLRPYGSVVHSGAAVWNVEHRGGDTARRAHLGQRASMASFFLLSKSSVVVSAAKESTFSLMAAVYGNVTMVSMSARPLHHNTCSFVLHDLPEFRATAKARPAAA